MFIDTHCHLEFIEKDASALVANAKKAGVEIIVANGVNLESNKKVLALAKKFPVVKAALGLYPTEVVDLSSKNLEELFSFIRDHEKNLIALGEVGMDYKELEDREKQEKIFVRVLNLAKELDVPVIVHSRKAEERCIELIEQSGHMKVIMHCFSGKKKLVSRITQNGWTLTVPTSVVRSEQFQYIARETPLTQLLCETDSPYLSPDKTFPNEPANVVASYEAIARLRGISLRDVEKQLEKNFLVLFGSVANI